MSWNPFYDDSFVWEKCDHLDTYSDLFHAIKRGENLKPLYMWEGWLQVIDKAILGWIDEAEFIAELEEHDRQIEEELMRED